jgi:hypothetical protein
VLDAVRELGAERVLLVPAEGVDVGEVADVLEPLGVETEVRQVDGPMLLGSVALVQEIAREHRDRREDLVVDVGAAGRYQSCAFLSAAFVAGVSAIDREDGEIQQLPVLRFSYDEVVGRDELAILESIEELGGEAGLHAVADTAGLDSSTVTYKVRGGEDAEGLEPLGLVEVGMGESGIVVRLTSMGGLLGDALRL